MSTTPAKNSLTRSSSLSPSASTLGNKSPISPYRQELLAEAASKERKVHRLRGTILEYSDQINSKTVELEEKRLKKRGTTIAKKRLDQYAFSKYNDMQKRPPDRLNDSKIVTKMDTALRASSDLRGWFSKYAPETAEDNIMNRSSTVLPPHRTGYTLRVDE